MKNIKQKGFTLIELLVVIAIIALLSSIVLSTLTVARAKARDAHRQSDAIQMRNALTTYYLDNGGFPKCTNTPGIEICTGTNLTNGLATALTLSQNTVEQKWWDIALIKIARAADLYIADIPVDPLNTAGYTYYYYTGPAIKIGYVDKNGKTVNLSERGSFYYVSESKSTPGVSYREGVLI